jgi:hypothetical protein
MESPVRFTPSYIAASGDTDAVRLVALKVGGAEVLAPRPPLPLLHLHRPQSLACDPINPETVVELTLASMRDTPAEVTVVLTDER